MGLPRRPPATLRLAVIAIFAAVIAVGTILSIPLPPPLYEITWSPAIYLALSVLVDPWTAFSAIAIGSFLGETYGIATRGGPAIFIAGIVWARAPEALIISWARKKGLKSIVLAMVLATVYETVAFFVPDWLFYTYGLFGYGSPTDVVTGFYAASADFLTIVDLVYIPIAIAIIRYAGPTFKRLGFLRVSEAAILKPDGV
jgi:riboflavin transporter FmnP